jgi:hypothetical protein
MRRVFWGRVAPRPGSLVYGEGLAFEEEGELAGVVARITSPRFDRGIS